MSIKDRVLLMIDKLTRERNKGKQMPEAVKNGVSMDSTVRKINKDNRRRNLLSRLIIKPSELGKTGATVTRSSQYSSNDRNNAQLIRNKSKYNTGRTKKGTYR